ncbi:Ldh family oxidoreductase [Paenibacillus larvae]
MRETFPRTKTYTIESLRQKVQNRFEQAGLSEYQAREMSEQLLYAEMRGISSHGLVRIKWVTEQLHKYPLKNVRLLLQNREAELYDADGVLGYLALNEVAEKEQRFEGQTIKFIGIRNTYPTGALSYFSEKLAAKGWIVLMSSTSPRRVGLYGDDKGLVGTNPWTFTLPVETNYSGQVVVDVSLSEITHGQCLKAVEAGQPLPNYAASQPGGLAINHPDDLWKEGNWNAILHPVGRDKGFKPFGVMWSLHVMGSRMLGLDGVESHGTFILLLSPSMWEPIIPAYEVIKGFNEEVKLLSMSKVAHVPGEGRMSRLKEQKDQITVTQEIVNMFD